jgi:hypothetical protein
MPATLQQDAEAGSSPAEWRVVWLERENGGAGFSGNWAGFAKDQVRLLSTSFYCCCPVSLWLSFRRLSNGPI